MKKAKLDKELIFLVEKSADGGLEARALGYPIFTEAENLEEFRKAIKDAVKCHFENKESPHIVRTHIVKDEVISV